MDQVPSQYVHSILKYTTAQQLALIENINPVILSETDIIWKTLITKEFTMYSKEDEPVSWRELYNKLQQEAKDKQQKIAKRLRALKQESEDHRESKKITLLDKAPRAKGTSSTKRMGIFSKLRNEVKKTIPYYKTTPVRKS